MFRQRITTCSTCARDAFRQDLYTQIFTRRADSLLDLTDAILTCPSRVTSLPEMSLLPAFRRRHGMIYDALAKGRIETAGLEDQLTAVAETHIGGPIVYALDVSVYPRPDAETLPGRELVAITVGDRHLGTPGFAYSFLARISIGDSPWALPVSARRHVPSTDGTIVATEQVRDLTERLPAGARALIVADAGYPAGKMAHLFSPYPVDLLVRVRTDRVFYRQAEILVGRTGRPRRYGSRLEVADPSRLLPADETATGNDRHGRHIRVSAWHRIYSKASGVSPLAVGSLLIVSVGEHLPPLPLFWAGRGMPDLLLCARAYLARFDIEHTFRFWKRTLGWRVPLLGAPAAIDRWTQVLLAVHAQLLLARGAVAEVRLPWWAPAAPDRISPGRVRRSFHIIHAIVGTPAGKPKVVRAGSGWPPGRKRTRRSRQEPFRKTVQPRF